MDVVHIEQLLCYRRHFLGSLEQLGQTPAKFVWCGLLIIHIYSRFMEVWGITSFSR